MKLYHATPSQNVEAILRQGLKPWAQLGDLAPHNYRGTGSPNYVWFTTSTYRHFAETVIGTRRGDTDVTLLEVELDTLDEANMRPSNVYLATVMRYEMCLPLKMVWAINGLPHAQRHVALQQWFGQNDGEFRRYWRNSLERGEVAHEGVIHPNLLRIAEPLEN